MNMNVGFTAGLVLTGPEKERALPERRQNVIFQTCIFFAFSRFLFDFGKTRKGLVLESDCTTSTQLVDKIEILKILLEFRVKRNVTWKMILNTKLS